MTEVICRNADAAEKVQSFRGRFRELGFCFNENPCADPIQPLHELL